MALRWRVLTGLRQRRAEPTGGRQRPSDAASGSGPTQQQGIAPIRPTSSPSAAPTISTRARGTENATAATRSRAGPSQRSPWFLAMLPPTTIRCGLNTSTSDTHASANARRARSMISAAVVSPSASASATSRASRPRPRAAGERRQATRPTRRDRTGRRPRDRAAGRDALEMAARAAATRRPVDLDEDVAQLARDAVRPADQPATGHDRAADPGRDRQVEEVGQIPGRPERPLGQRRDVRVPLEHRRDAERSPDRAGQGGAAK